MRLLHKIFIYLTLAVLLTGAAYAQNDSEVVPPSIELDTSKTDEVRAALPQEAKDVLGELDLKNPQMGDEGLEKIWKTVRESFFSIFKKALTSAAKILTIIIICAAASSTLDDGGTKDTVALCGAIAISAIAISDVNVFFGMGVRTLHTLSDFSKVLLPLMCTAAASAGAVSSASAKFAASALFMDLLLTVGIKVVMPMISVYLASVVASAALGKDTLASVSKFLKWGCTTALTLLMMAFTTYLGMTGLISGKSDEFALKLTKSAIGAMLPVVGGIVSDAAGTIVAGAGILRNVIGVFGFLAVAAVCITPFLTLGTHYLVYKGTAALSEALTDKRMAELIDGVGVAFGMVLALVGAGGLMLFISVISSMRAVSG